MLESERSNASYIHSLGGSGAFACCLGAFEALGAIVKLWWGFANAAFEALVRNVVSLATTTIATKIKSRQY